LIKKMLVIDSTKRATMAEVMSDKWYMEGCEAEPSQIITLAQTPTLSPEEHKAVLDEMEELGLERVQIEKSLADGLYDYLTATYYLVADRRSSGVPAIVKAPGLSQAAKANPSTKTSKATELEILEEDEDGVANPPKEKVVKEVKKEVQSASAAQPPKVVAGGRRRAATTTANDILDTSKPIVPIALVKPIVPVKVEPVAAPAPQTRGRSHTMQQDRKSVDEEEGPTVPIDQFRVHLKDEPRTARFTFSVSTTSTKEPPAVFEIVKKSLADAQIKFTAVAMTAVCTSNDVEFEIEVCKLPNLQVVGLRCKRLHGDAFAYKDILSSLIATMNL
jgi:Kinase associated domain 1